MIRSFCLTVLVLLVSSVVGAVIDARRTYEQAAIPVEMAPDTTWLVKLRRGRSPRSTDARWPGFSRGMGFGGWLTNYKRFNVLPEDKRLLITEGDLEHFDTFLSEADVARVASWGFDHVRIGFDQIVLEETSGVWRERTFRRLDAFVGWCEKHGLNIVLNLHKAIGNYCDIPEKVQLLDDEDLQRRFIALWLEIERRYHDKPGIAFELLNEVRDVDPQKWNALADRTIRALREKNPDRWIVVGSTKWNASGKLAQLKVWDDPKVVYTFHMYDPSEFTHQRGVLQQYQLGYNRALAYPSSDLARYRGYYEFYGWKPPFKEGELVDRHYLKRRMAGAEAFVKAHPDKILWNGEFGTIRHADPASRVAYMRDVVSICREWGIPYCVWNYLSTPNDGNRFSLVDDDTREFLSDDLLKACLGLWDEPDIVEPEPERVTKRIELLKDNDISAHWYTWLRETGRDNDPLGVFTASNGVLKVTGKDYGCVTTRKAYRDYKLTLEYRFIGDGELDRKGKARDGGILYHSIGPDGAICEGKWMMGFEYNIIQGGTGDMIVAGGRGDKDGSSTYCCQALVAADGYTPENWRRWHHDPKGTWVWLHDWSRMHGVDYDRDWKDSGDQKLLPNENPTGEWNTCELICRGDRADYYFNGKRVNWFRFLTPSGGRIQLQSEAQGIEYRNIVLEPLD